MRIVKFILLTAMALTGASVWGQTHEAIPVKSGDITPMAADSLKSPSFPADSLKAPLTYSDMYLDTVKINRVFEVNDYSLIGVEYGVSFNRMLFNPPYTQATLFVPNTFGVFYTRYGKMFGYMPYFGFKIGLRYSHEGYKFKEDKETKTTYKIEGATQAIMDVVEVPFMAHLHLDGLHYKIMADVGIYGGHRLSITRTGEGVSESLANSFKDTDRRFDYGLCGGLGFGLVFDPVEFHVNVNVRYSWGTIYDPDYVSPDYYRFAYPFDIMATAGVYFQLTRRTGRGKAQLRREAYQQVYYPKQNENVDGKGR